jgi:hypothetical protein
MRLHPSGNASCDVGDNSICAARRTQQKCRCSLTPSACFLRQWDAYSTARSWREMRYVRWLTCGAAMLKRAFSGSAVLSAPLLAEQMQLNERRRSPEPAEDRLGRPPVPDSPSTKTGTLSPPSRLCHRCRTYHLCAHSALRCGVLRGCRLTSPIPQLRAGGRRMSGNCPFLCPHKHTNAFKLPGFPGGRGLPDVDCLAGAGLARRLVRTRCGLAPFSWAKAGVSCA